MTNVVSLSISDIEWLQVMLDLEDLQAYTILKHNLRFRAHLIKEKRALRLQHLRSEN